MRKSGVKIDFTKIIVLILVGMNKLWVLNKFFSILSHIKMFASWRYMIIVDCICIKKSSPNEEMRNFDFFLKFNKRNHEKNQYTCFSFPE